MAGPKIFMRLLPETASSQEQALWCRTMVLWCRAGADASEWGMAGIEDTVWKLLPKVMVFQDRAGLSAKGDIIAIVRPCKQAHQLPKRHSLLEKPARYESGAGLR